MATILVVDDMAILRDPIAASLRSAGFQTLCAANGLEALDVIKMALPDLILLDLTMPVMDGLTFLAKLRAQPSAKNVPVILLTSVSEKNAVLQAAHFGVREYVLKTRVSLRDLITRVQKTLANPTPARPATAKANSPDQNPQSNTSAQAPANTPGNAAAHHDAKASPTSAHAGAAGSVAKPESAAASAAPHRAAPAANAPAGAIPSLLTRDQCVRRAQSAFQTKSLSGVVTQVISLAASPRGDLSLLAGLIAKDPMLSAKVLQVANSAAYVSSRGPVTALPDAVRQIGTTTVRNLAAALGIFDAMPRSVVDGFDPIRCWQHSFAVGLLCERLITPIDPDLTGAAYMVGLCHDLGEILFRSHFQEEYQQVLEVRAATGKRMDELERLMLGMTQDDLVITILNCLKLPEAIRRPIEALRHAAGSGDLQDPLAKVLRLANVYAHGVLLASTPAALIRPLTNVECKAALKQNAVEGPEPEMFRSEIYMLTGMLARSANPDQAKLMAPLLSRINTRVVITRHPTLSSFDPIESACKSIASVRASTDIPAPGDLDEIDALIVTAPTTANSEISEAEIQALMKIKPSLKVLWMVGKTDAANPTVPPAKTWPISLETLAAFLKSAVPVQQAQAA